MKVDAVERELFIAGHELFKLSRTFKHLAAELMRERLAAKASANVGHETPEVLEKINEIGAALLPLSIHLKGPE